MAMKDDPLCQPLPFSIQALMGLDETQSFSLKNVIGGLGIPASDMPTSWDDPIYMSGFAKKKQPRRKGKGLLSLKERRELGLYRLRRKDMKYEDFLPLHKLWKEYFIDYMNFDLLIKQGFQGYPTDKQWETVSRMLMKADYHGAILTVQKSLCSSLVGKKGILVFDTKNTFQLISEDNVLRIIPKQSAIFSLTVKQFKFTILGSQFCIKSAARNTKKIKCLSNIDL